MKSSATEIALRYVNALFPLAEKEGSLAVVEKELNELAAQANKEGALADFLANPLLDRAQIESVVSAIATSAKLSQLTQNFLITLAKQKRLSLLSVIAGEFSKLAEKARGELTAEVVSAAPLSQAELAAVAERLGKAYNKKINLHASVDASLLGGVVVKIGSQQLDGSLAGKLNRLNIALKAA